MRSRKRLVYELIRNDNGHIIQKFTNKTTGLQYSCQWITNYPEDTNEVSFLVLERGSGRVVLRIGGPELALLCEDEGIEAEDDVDYEA